MVLQLSDKPTVLPVHGGANGWICRVSLGLTVYLPAPPTAADVRHAWACYRAVCPPDRLRLARSTLVTSVWEPVDSTGGEPNIDRYLGGFDRRLDYGLGVWDGSRHDCWSFRAQGVVVDGATAASFIQVYFPDDVAPEAMVALARRLAAKLDFVSGHGGHVAVFRQRWKSTAFDRIYGWAKRYLGLEVEDLNRTLPFVTDAIKGASWLTLISHHFGQRLLQTQNKALPLPPEVVVHRETRGWVLRAGEQPVLADRHRRQFPESYATVERALQSLKVTNHAEFAGRFGREHATMRWLRRLLEQEAW